MPNYGPEKIHRRGLPFAPIFRSGQAPVDASRNQVFLGQGGGGPTITKHYAGQGGVIREGEGPEGTDGARHFVGTRRFSSSNQFCTTMMLVGAGVSFDAPPTLIIRKRWPSGETS